MAGEIEIVVVDVNDIEARVQALYRGSVDGVVLTGTIRGPFCEKARTLPAEFSFRDLGERNPAAAEAIIPDPCTWSPEVPHVYRIEIEARQNEQVVASYRDTIGLRTDKS